MRRKTPFVTALRTLSLAAALCAAGAAQAFTIPAGVWTFGEDFESGLPRWSNQNPSGPDAVVVADPLNPNNHVLAFTQLIGGGSLFSTIGISTNSQYTLSFDYLGLPGLGGRAGDLGGYIGVSTGDRGSPEMWLGGTGSYATPLNLIDDGQWHSYMLVFSASISGPLRLKVEDWDGSGGVAGDAFFDNIVLRDSGVDAPDLNRPSAPRAPQPPQAEGELPEPGSLALVGLALLGLGAARARGRKG